MYSRILLVGKPLVSLLFFMKMWATREWNDDFKLKRFSDIHTILVKRTDKKRGK